MSLKTYHQKRKFDKTPEPKGKLRRRLRAASWRASFGKLRTRKKHALSFVVQEHHATHLHYDFRLELDGVLKSWAIPKGPSMDPSEKHLAVMVEDHPFSYRKFEGTIPKGNYGAGTVKIWDEGTYSPVEQGKDAQKILREGLKKGDLKFILHGKKLTGEFALVKFGKEEKNWLLIKKKEEVALPSTSLRAAKGKKAPMPHEIKPMLGKLADAPFDDPNFIFETKWDGYRAISEINKGKIKLYSRNNQNYTDIYPEVVESLKNISHDVILDGEIVAINSYGKIEFQLLQDYRKGKDKATLIYYVFDLLYLDGHDTRQLPLIERKALLKQILPETAHLKYSDHIETYGKKLFDLAKEKNIEGIMAKSKDSKYISERSGSWLKIKHVQTQEAVICGFTKPRGQRKEFGALVLGIYEGDELRYIGHTGGGFDEEKLQSIIKILKPLATDTSPFEIAPETNMPVTWVKPKIVCQVKFSGWTNDKIMRQPIFLGQRADKKPEEVKFEVPAVAHKIATKHFQPTNLDKVFWPIEGFTKGDVISYYDRISSIILPYLKGRPQSLLRHPDGIEGASFFQKDIQNPPNWLKTVRIYSEHDKKEVNWLICNDRETLLYMVQLGCIEINPWSSRFSKKDYPDYLIIDLDPEGVAFSEGIETALHIKKLMDKAEMDGFIKTSGKRGLHILIPLGAKYTFEQTRKFAELLANIVASNLPKTTSVTRNPEKREKKVYIDFLQNRMGQTITAPYSLRPVPLATVSTPLEWSELNGKLHPTDFTIKNIFARLRKKGDIWKPLLKHRGIEMLKSLDILGKLPLNPVA